VHLVGDGGARINNGLEQGEVQLALTTVINEMFSGRLLYPVYVAVVAPSHALGRLSSIRSPTSRTAAALAATVIGLARLVRRGMPQCRCEPTYCAGKRSPTILTALASSGDGAAVVASNVSILRDGVKAIP